SSSREPRAPISLALAIHLVGFRMELVDGPTHFADVALARAAARISLVPQRMQFVSRPTLLVGSASSLDAPTRCFVRLASVLVGVSGCFVSYAGTQKPANRRLTTDD